MEYIEQQIQYKRAPTPRDGLWETHYINEQGEREERKMSLNSLLNNDSQSDQDDVIDRASIKIEDADSMHADSSNPPSPASSYSSGCVLVPIQSTPTSNRAVCHICKSESGRCHASDPSTMQTFFANTMGFDGVLSTADWLCMKCYSKWYNRCKRKASSNANTSSGAPADALSTTPSKKRKRDKEGHMHKSDRDRSCDLDKDTDSDDALLLARMGQSQFSPTPIALTPSSMHSEDIRDVEGEVDSLRDEVRTMKAEMTKMVQEQAKRDEQMEGLLTFVKTEFSAMHDLFKELAESRWGGFPMASAPAITARDRALNLAHPIQTNMKRVAEDVKGCEAL